MFFAKQILLRKLSFFHLKKCEVGLQVFFNQYNNNITFVFSKNSSSLMFFSYCNIIVIAKMNTAATL